MERKKQLYAIQLERQPQGALTNRNIPAHRNRTYEKRNRIVFSKPYHLGSFIHRNMSDGEEIMFILLRACITVIIILLL